MKKCFLIAPLGAENSEVRKRTETIWEFLVEPVCGQLQYEAVRADLMAGTGLITQDIIRMLFDAELVVADITNANPNVMYELGLRHSSGKPVIILAQDGRTFHSILHPTESYCIRSIRVLTRARPTRPYLQQSNTSKRPERPRPLSWMSLVRRRMANGFRKKGSASMVRSFVQFRKGSIL